MKVYLVRIEYAGGEFGNYNGLYIVSGESKEDAEHKANKVCGGNIYIGITEIDISTPYYADEF